jgi:glucosamine 6-phosphate synthetase-like amidotransferase/phosphosugar isomerase protein
MCGIVGMSFRCEVSTRKHKIDNITKIFTEMLVSAQERGAAATGIAMMTCAPGAEKTDAWVLRSPLPATEFVKTQEYKDIIGKVDTNCLSLIGHTRAVSGNNAGAENNHNNHPHVHGSIIGVHNGRILNDDKLWSKYKDHMKSKGICDSEVIVAMVNYFLESDLANTTEEAIEMAISESDIWYALAFLDTKSPNKVFIVKDKSTPLSLGWWGSPEIGMFASEWKYIEKAYTKHGFVKTGNAIKRCTVPANQIITLDSTVRDVDWTDLYVGKHTIKKTVDVDKLIAANVEEYQVTQGK